MSQKHEWPELNDPELRELSRALTRRGCAVPTT